MIKGKFYAVLCVRYSNRLFVRKNNSGRKSSPPRRTMRSGVTHARRAPPQTRFNPISSSSSFLPISYRSQAN